MTVIKRFKDRKLYSMAISQYISLKDVAEMIRINEDFVVVSNVTKRDITAITYAETLVSELRNSRLSLGIEGITKIKDLLQSEMKVVV